MANPDLIAGYPKPKYRKKTLPDWATLLLIVVGVAIFILLQIWVANNSKCQPYRDSSGEYIEC